MTEAPELFVNETIRLPIGYGPGIYEALRRPLFVKSFDGRVMEFVASGTGLSGYAFEAVRDLGATERGRELQVEFRTGVFGFKPLLKQLNIWAMASHGVETFADTMANHEHFVTKEGPHVMVRLVLTSSENSITIPVYDPAVRGPVETMLREQASQAAGANEMAKTYHAGYEAAKTVLFVELKSIVADRWPELPEDVNGAMAALASNVMSGDVSDIPFQRLNDEQIRAGEVLGREQFDSREDLRETSLEATYALAMSKLMQSVDLRCGIVDNFTLHEAIKGVNMLIQRGSKPSLYLSTLAQCYNTGRENAAGYEAATRAVEADPANAEAWRLKGNGAWMFDRRGEALECYARAKALDPSIQGMDQAVLMIRAELAQGAPR